MFKNKLKNRIEALEKLVGKEPLKFISPSFLFPFLRNFNDEKSLTIFERIEKIDKKLEKLEEYLQIKYTEENKEFKGYKKLKVK